MTIPAFTPFYAHVVPAEVVAGALGEVAAAAVEPDRLAGVLAGIRAATMSTVESQAFRALVGEFHAFRDSHGLPADPSSDQALERFRTHIGDPTTIDRILDDHPVLRRRLDTMVRDAMDAFREVLTAFVADQAALTSAELLAPRLGSELITGLFPTGSDAHNRGRQVVGVEVSSGARIVYKPRSLASDAFLHELYAAAEPYLRYSLRECVPASVTAESHGWQRFIRATSMDTTAQARRYYYRFGALCAIFGSIGASDLHDENMLAAGEFPCVLDTETLIRADAGVADDSLPHLLINQLKTSIVSTMLVPVRNPDSPVDVLMAGVGVAGDQQSTMKRSVVRNEDNDAIHVAREPFAYTHGSNVARLGGEPLRATDYFADIVDGYVAALAAVRGPDLVKVLDNYPGMRVRCLMRSTLVYGRYIDAATHPSYLREPAAAERLFGLLSRYPDYLSPAAVEFVGAAERASMSIGDIPYFVTRADSRALSTPDCDATGPEAHRCTPIEFARSGIERNRDRTDAYHRYLLESCFGELFDADSPAGLSDRGVFAGSAAAAAGAWWPGIARLIADVSVPFDGSNGMEIGWLGGGSGAIATVVPGNYVAFHDHGGIVTFLGRAARLDPELCAPHAGAERGLTALLAEHAGVLRTAPESVFSGTSSLLLTRPADTGRDWLDARLTEIDERAARGELGSDLAGGPAGVLMVALSQVEDGEPGRWADTQLTRLRHRVVQQLGAPSRPWFEVAHGELGLRWACARIGRVLDEPELAVGAAEWLLDRWDSAERPATAGWCAGHAGVLLAAAEIMTSAGHASWLSGERLVELVDRATALPADAPVELSVCHGSSGVVQALLATAGILGEPELLVRAREYQELVLDRVRRNGFYTGSAGKTAVLGYMLGWSGVGDTDLLLAAAGGDPVGVPVALRWLP
jgi:class II lanthipeptide synthase